MTTCPICRADTRGEEKVCDGCHVAILAADPDDVDMIGAVLRRRPDLVITYMNFDVSPARREARDFNAEVAADAEDAADDLSVTERQFLRYGTPAPERKRRL